MQTSGIENIGYLFCARASRADLRLESVICMQGISTLRSAALSLSSHYRDDKARRRATPRRRQERMRSSIYCVRLPTAIYKRGSTAMTSSVLPTIVAWLKKMVRLNEEIARASPERPRR